MKVYFDKRFRQWCANASKNGKINAAWGDTEEEAVKRLKKANK